MFNYSIIIPHYNRPDLLDRLLASIPDRSDVEVIIVDDNSSSVGFDYNAYWAKKKEKYKVLLTTLGKGAGFARNQGLKIAQGKWLLFADSDDYYLPNAFDIFDRYLETDYDIVYFSTESRFSDTGELSDRNRYYNALIDDYFSGTERGVNCLRYHFGPPWAKMIKHDLVRNSNEYDIIIMFDEVKHFNDMMFSTKIGFLADKIIADRHKVYCITVAYGSLVHTMSYEALKQRYLIILSQNDFFRMYHLGEYQRPVMSFLRKSFKYGGLKGFLEFVNIGKSHNCDFFRGASKWIVGLWRLLVNKNDKKSYIKYE